MQGDTICWNSSIILMMLPRANTGGHYFRVDYLPRNSRLLLRITFAIAITFSISSTSTEITIFISVVFFLLLVLLILLLFLIRTFLLLLVFRTFTLSSTVANSISHYRYLPLLRNLPRRHIQLFLKWEP